MRVKPFVVILVAAFALSAFWKQSWAWPGVKSVDTKTYDLTSDGSVSVDDSSGDVTVSGWDQDHVEVTTRKSAWSNDDLNNLGSTVDAKSDRIAIAAQFPRHCMNCDVSFQIRVPMHAHVSIVTASGDVRVSSVSGPARINSSSGDVTLKNLGGAVQTHSSSGDLDIDGMSAALDGYTSSGDIKAIDLSGDTDLVASSGSVDASFSDFSRVHAVRLQSSSGDISLTVPRGVGFKIDATTASGSIDSNLRLPIHEGDAGADVVAQVGDGKATVELRATSGDIGITMR